VAKKLVQRKQTENKPVENPFTTILYNKCSYSSSFPRI